jgi:hypothetical protein
MPKPSSITQLPPDILERLQSCLRDPRITQLETVDIVNELLAAEGREERVTKSSLNRYAMRMEEVGAKLRQSREVAQMWIGKLGATPQSEVGNLVNEILRTLSFDIGIKLQADELNEESMPGVVKMLKELSLTALRLERAASENVKRDEEIRKQALAEAAQSVEKEARRQGASAATIDSLRAAIRQGLSA